MPVQVVPPMFRMLEEELQWAIDDVGVSSYRCLAKRSNTDSDSLLARFSERTLSFLGPLIPLSSVPLFDRFVR